MWISQEDARSDFVLAIAAVVLVAFLRDQLVAPLAIYPSTGLVRQVLDLVWLVLVVGAAPVALARYRGQGGAAFGTADGSGGVVIGLVTLAPVVVAHLLPITLEGDFAALLEGLGGRLADPLPALPTVVGLSASDRVLLTADVIVIALGSWLLVAFLVVRARDAFRSPDMELTEAIRTFGMGAVAATWVFGLLNAVRGLPVGDVARLGVALLVMVLVTDQYVPPRVTTTRATVLGPAIAVVVLWVLAFGGPFRGDLLAGLYGAAAAAVLVVCTAALLEIRRGWGAAVLVIGSVIYGLPGFTVAIPSPQPLPSPLLGL